VNIFNIDDRNIHTYIIGEHGDSEVPTWSLTNIAGMNLDDYCKNVCKKYDELSKNKIHHDVKNAAYEVINRKGATYFAVGLAIRRIVEAIFRDENFYFNSFKFA
jgi:Malate/lactate dehydrogenases